MNTQVKLLVKICYCRNAIINLSVNKMKTYPGGIPLICQSVCSLCRRFPVGDTAARPQTVSVSKL